MSHEGGALNLALFYGPRTMGTAVSPLDRSLRRDHADISGERFRRFIAKAEIAKRAEHKLVSRRSANFRSCSMEAVVSLRETDRRKVVLDDIRCPCRYRRGT